MKNELTLLKKEFNEIQVYSPDQLILKYNPQAIQKTFRGIKTVKQAIQENDSSLSVLKKATNEETLILLIELHLQGLNQAINVHQKITEYQANEIAQEILSNYYYFSIVEINLIFNRAKLGHYGVINYAITMPQIMIWFKDYSSERMSHFENNQEQQNQKFKTDKTIIDGKLFKTNDAQFNKIQIDVLKSFRATLSDKKQFNNDEYQEYKKTLLK